MNSDWLRQDKMEPMVGDSGAPTCALQLARAEWPIHLLLHPHSRVGQKGQDLRMEIRNRSDKHARHYVHTPKWWERS